MTLHLRGSSGEAVSGANRRKAGLYMSAICIALGAMGVHGAQASAVGEARSTGRVDAARVIAEAVKGENWLVNGRDFGASHFSPLNEVNERNVSRLGLAWSADVDSPMGMPTEPLAVDGVIYVPGSLNRVFAYDAASGKLIWKFDPQIHLDNTMMGSYSARVARGVAVWEGKVFIGTGDCRLVAIDAARGAKLWDTEVCDPRQTGITGAPRVGNGKVFIGYFGSDTGTRGSLVALDANSGKIAWRFWNMPGDPAKGFDKPALAMAAKTWQGKEWWKAGGAVVWDPITFDPTTGYVIYGTAGPSSGLDEAIETRGDRLFSNCIIALKADTGEYVWHYQTSKLAPHHVSPENFHIVVTDVSINGVKRHVAMTVPRFGGFVVLDALTGKLISWKSMAERPANQLSPPTVTGKPRSTVGHNWWPMSWNPLTKLAYVPLYDQPPLGEHELLADAVGRLVAWDPLTQTSRWSIGQPYAINGGLLSTAGNLVFQGEGTGEFVAWQAATGKKLWSIKTGSAIQGVPITYSLGGKQYILVPVGLGGGTRMFTLTSAMASPEAKRGPSRLLAFAIGATTPFPYPNVVVPRVPKPPEQSASAEIVARGKHVLEAYECWGCHGGTSLDGSGAWILNGAVPDLRYMPADVHQQFLGIVMGGSQRPHGMPGFSDGKVNWPHSKQMTLDEANALHAYIIDLQWQAYRADQRESGTR